MQPEGLAFLQGYGFHLLSVLETENLPDDVSELLRGMGAPLERYAKLVLVGHAGPDFWRAFSQAKVDAPHPVDAFSTQIVRQFIDQFLDDSDYEWLYPSEDYVIPLQRLARAAHWGSPSPLGLDISPQYGLWFAHRAAFLSNAGLEERREPEAPSPCTNCTSRECISHCPAGAVTLENFALQSCTNYRHSEASACRANCLSRWHCPYAAKYRYSQEQMRYHYSFR